MNKILITTVCILMLSCAQQKNKAIVLKNPVSEVREETLDNFDWLVGNWKKKDESGEKITFENWRKVSEELYHGHGFIMKGQDTLWQEKMIFTYESLSWVLKVETPGNEDRVDFKLSESNSSSFTVENQNHDFPKVIKYWSGKDLLHALVSGSGQEIEFDFESITKN